MRRWLRNWRLLVLAVVSLTSSTALAVATWSFQETNDRYCLNGPACTTYFSSDGTNLLLVTGGTVQINGTTVTADTDVPITFYSAQTTGSGLLHQITMSRAGTFKTAIFATDVTGVGAGNFVTKVCLDGATCAAGNTAWTCTTACTSAADAATSCSAGAATGWNAGQTISWSIATACGTTNQIGGIDMGNTEP